MALHFGFRYRPQPPSGGRRSPAELERTTGSAARVVPRNIGLDRIPLSRSMAATHLFVPGNSVAYAAPVHGAGQLPRAGPTERGSRCGLYGACDAERVAGGVGLLVAQEYAFRGQGVGGPFESKGDGRRALGTEIESVVMAIIVEPEVEMMSLWARRKFVVLFELNPCDVGQRAPGGGDLAREHGLVITVMSDPKMKAVRVVPPVDTTEIARIEPVRSAVDDTGPLIVASLR